MVKLRIKSYSTCSRNLEVIMNYYPNYYDFFTNEVCITCLDVDNAEDILLYLKISKYDDSYRMEDMNEKKEEKY